MRLRPDGSIQSSATPTQDNIAREVSDEIYRCMVIKTIFVDDPDNITKNATNPRVLYDVVVLGGFDTGQTISNCRLASYLGGNSNYYERVLRPSSKSLKGSKLSEHDGDVVLVQFLQSHSSYPQIVALDNGLNTVGKIGANRSDGIRSKGEFNGINEEINKDGEMILTRKGGKYNSEKTTFEPASAVEAELKFLDGKVILGDTANQMTISKKNGNVVIDTAGGAQINVDGKNGKITLTKGATIIELDSNSGKISLKAGFVDLGTSVSDFVTLFMELASAFNSHTHPFPYFAGPSPAAGTTMPPAAPLLQTVGSQTVKVQA